MDGLVELGRRGERRAHILGAAERVFARHSYEGASMDEIAHAAGLGKPTIYRYFPSKDELFTAVFAERLDRLDAHMTAVLRRETEPEARLLGLVTALIPTFRDHLVPARVLEGGSAATDLSKRRVFRERRARIAELLAEAIGEGRSGHGVDPARAAQLVIGMVWSGAAAIRASDAAIAADVVRLVFHGVGAASRDRSQNWRTACSAERALTDDSSGPARPLEAISR